MDNQGRYTITAANSKFTLSIQMLYEAPVQLHGYAADDVFTMDATAPTEVLMGVDGWLSGGYVFVEKRLSISLQADSDSNAIFENWYAFMQREREVVVADAEITLPAINRIYTFTRGFLTSYPMTPDARRVLQPRRYQITFATCDWAPGGAVSMQPYTPVEG